MLVHGLWMHGLAFGLQRRRLLERGFDARSFSYPSVSGRLADNARALADFVATIEAPVIHLVGHSLGGLVILCMLARHPDPRIRRVVLLGSPCGGSHCARVLQRVPLLRAIVGRSLRDWQDRPCLPPPPGVEIGVLAGGHGIGLGRLVPGLARPNDGVVTVAETQLDEACDALVLSLGHSQMLWSMACLAQLEAFLRMGRFSR